MDLTKQLETLTAECDRQSGRIAKCQTRVNAERTKLAKEQEKLNALKSRLEQTEYQLLKAKLADAGIDEGRELDELITFYKKQRNQQ